MHTLAAAVTVLHLVIGPETILPDVSINNLSREIGAIWAPLLRVVLEPADVPPRADVLRVVLRTAEPPMPPQSRTIDQWALGSVEFVDGEPRPVITVFPGRVRATVNRAEVAGRRVELWPPVVGQRLTAIALGRAIAHEIGHYVMRSPAHSKVGLMRAGFGPRDLTARGLAGFELSSTERERVARRLASPMWAGVPPSETAATRW